MIDTGQLRKQPATNKYTFYLVAGWTALVLASLIWNTHNVHDSHMEKARIEARTLYDMSLAYRNWGTSHGSVYVPITEKVLPNPYLKVSDRDILTGKGKKLTLVNPAWMTREVFEALRSQSSLPIINHITSLKYLNPLNRPDAWEEKCLHAFEQGVAELSEVQFIENRPYMRLHPERGLELHIETGFPD